MYNILLFPSQVYICRLLKISDYIYLVIWLCSLAWLKSLFLPPDIFSLTTGVN